MKGNFHVRFCRPVGGVTFLLSLIRQTASYRSESLGDEKCDDQRLLCEHCKRRVIEQVAYEIANKDLLIPQYQLDFPEQ